MIIVTDLLIIDHLVSVSLTLPYLPLVFIKTVKTTEPSFFSVEGLKYRIE